MQNKVARPKLEDENWRKRARQFMMSPDLTAYIEKRARQMKVTPKVSASLLIENLCLSEGISRAKDFIDGTPAPGRSFPRIEPRAGDKKKKTYTISNYANTALDAWSVKLWQSRAKIVEYAVRGGGLEDAIAFIKEK